jgi:23S rRNA pseudouridine955/2504/2580 synthase
MSKSRAQAIPQVRLLPVEETHAGQRLDNFLSSRLKGVPKTHIYRLVRRGEVRVNKGRVKPDHRLATGDVVRIPPVRMVAPQPSQVDAGKFTWIEDRILHEDDSLLALDKPSGMPVHAGSGVAFGVIEALRAVRSHSPFLELVHRLDRETSGCLLIAKTRPALLAMHSALRDGQVSKRYVALVKDAWRGGARTVEAALDRRAQKAGERHVRVSADEGREAATRFSPKQVFRRPLPATLVEIDLYTGRTHQARVHAAHIGRPVAGDDKYGDRDFNRSMRGLGLDRLFLHAAGLKFRHPLGHVVTVRAPMPADLQSVLARFES